MIVENVPSDFLSQIDKSVCSFSDDSLFIYLVSRKTGFLQIMVYDIIKNKCVMLSADSTVAELFEQTEEFGLNSSILNPSVQFVDQSRLLISFDQDFFKYFEDGSTLLILIEMNFENSTFSIIDNLSFKDCYQSVLIRNEFRFLLVHSFAVNKDEFDGNEFLGFFDLQINDNRINQTKKERIAFNFNYQDRQPEDWHLNGNKLWFLRDEGTGPFKPHSLFKPSKPSKIYRQLSYFDLNESSPKEVKFELIDVTEYMRFQWLETTLLFYKEDKAEFSIFDLNNREWSKLKNNPEIIKLGYGNKNLVIFYKTNGYGSFYFDRDYIVTFIDKSTKRLKRVHLKTPSNLVEIV